MKLCTEKNDRWFKPFFFFCLFFLAIGLISTSLSAYELVKTEHRTFSIPLEATLRIIVDVGNVEISGWGKNTVRVQMRKWVNANTRKKAEKKMANLEVEFVQKENSLEIRELNRQENNFLANVLRKTGLKKDSSHRIDFVLTVPSRLSFEIEHGRGKIFLKGIHGNLSVKQREGKFRLSSAALDKVDLRFGRVRARISHLTGDRSPNANVAVSTQKGEFILLDSAIAKFVARNKESDNYLVANRISNCDIESEEGDIFLRPIEEERSHYKVFSVRGDVYLLIGGDPRCSVSLETGLGLIKSVHPWRIRKRGSGYYYFSPDSSSGSMSIITDLGDIMVEAVWQRGHF